MYRSFYRQPADVGELVEALGLADKRRTYYRSLSGGQQQRLSVVLALVGSPRTWAARWTPRKLEERGGALDAARAAGREMIARLNSARR